MDVTSEVQEYYAHGRERDRLERGAGLLEALRTTELLDGWLPAAPAVLLDIGGAAGRYAIPLAAAGYQVWIRRRARAGSRTTSLPVRVA